MQRPTLPKNKAVFPLIFGIFGFAVTAAVFVLIFLAVKNNTEIRSKAATSNRQIVKAWNFNGTSVENWKKSGGRGSFNTYNGSLLFYLFHQGTIQIKNSDEVVLPSGVKYIRFSLFAQRPITQATVGDASGVTKTSIGGGGPCSANNTCPAGYRCVSTSNVQATTGGRCLPVQPTQSTAQMIPLTIRAMVSEANKDGVSWKPSVVKTEVKADGAFHEYVLKLTDRMVTARVKDITFEFEDPSDVHIAKTPNAVAQEVKIDRIILEVLPIDTVTVIPKPSGDCVPQPTPVCSPNGGPCYVARQTGVIYCTPMATPTKISVPTPTNKPIVKSGPCWNKVFFANNTYNWPDSCRGMIVTSQMCAQVVTPLTASEITAYKNWNRQPIVGCQ